jgi:hypothetical protein
MLKCKNLCNVVYVDQSLDLAESPDDTDEVNDVKEDKSKEELPLMVRLLAMEHLHESRFCDYVPPHNTLTNVAI